MCWKEASEQNETRGLSGQCMTKPEYDCSKKNSFLQVEQRLIFKKENKKDYYHLCFITN